MSVRKHIVVYLTCLLFAGCAQYIPFAYEVEVQQGNIITEEMLGKLQSGMTREQVRYVLGTPAIEDPFHADRWDYLYSIDRENESMKVERLTIFFDGDQLARAEGSLAPARLKGANGS